MLSGHTTPLWPVQQKSCSQSTPHDSGVKLQDLNNQYTPHHRGQCSRTAVASPQPTTVANAEQLLPVHTAPWWPVEQNSCYQSTPHHGGQCSRTCVTSPHRTMVASAAGQLLPAHTAPWWPVQQNRCYQPTPHHGGQCSTTAVTSPHQIGRAHV